MKTFKEITQSLSAEYSLRTRELRIFDWSKQEFVARAIVPESDESDFWHGVIIGEVDVDFNLCKSEDDFKYSLDVYRVDKEKTTDDYTEVKLSVLTTYWCVSTTIFSNGQVVCNLIGETEKEEKPENVFKSTSVADRYVDYFDTEQDALEFVAQSKNA